MGADVKVLGDEYEGSVDCEDGGGGSGAVDEGIVSAPALKSRYNERIMSHAQSTLYWRLPVLFTEVVFAVGGDVVSDKDGFTTRWKVGIVLLSDYTTRH